MSYLGAVLRCSGSKAAITAFLADTRLTPMIVYWKGKPRTPSSKRISTVNGFNVTVSNSSSKRQASDARAFLKRNVADLKKLKALRIHWVIDFSIEVGDGDATRSILLSEALLEAVASLGGEIEVSAYSALDIEHAG